MGVTTTVTVEREGILVEGSTPRPKRKKVVIAKKEKKRRLNKRKFRSNKK